ncbi:MAG: dipeptidyl peptidase 3 [Prevotellaceae bacterium]|nr:dipeptidyl peptidase 3 [Prevotellaceae bacterium]
MLRYRVSAFSSLSPAQRRYLYYLSQAALTGRDILWDQNCRYNLRIRSLLERIYTDYEGDRTCHDFQQFTVYLKRVWFSNGIHHHYGCEKFLPGFSEEFLRQAIEQTGQPIDEELLRVIFDPTVLPKRVNQAQGDDLLQTSACNYYAPEVTQEMAESFYSRQKTDDPCPPMYGLNSRLEVVDGRLEERVWRSGGLYGETIDRIIHWLRLAETEAENEAQREVISTLVDFYRTGDLMTFDCYTIQWLQCTEGDIDFVNGFTEVYGDPLGLKASWEGYVNIKDKEATRRTETLSRNAQWFEDNSPIDQRFKKRECHGVTAKVVEAAMLGGDLYPSSAIGINLPNSNWVRQQYGSKSVTIGNLTHAYSEAAKGSGMREEFVIDKPTLDLLNQYDDLCDDLHTDLHECLGHGSGQLLKGVDPDCLKAYGNTIEETRADLFALYYIADPKLVELGLLPDGGAYKSQYYSYMLNGLLTQLVRIDEGKQIEEAHMRNRALIASWCLSRAEGAMRLVILNGKTYLQIDDYQRLRQLVSELLREVQRIKSEGDYDAARRLVETYGVSIDPSLHKEVLERYRRLDLAPYKGFINPVIKPVFCADGKLVDATIEYGEPYDHQMLRYGREYSSRDSH